MHAKLPNSKKIVIKILVLLFLALFVGMIQMKIPTISTAKNIFAHQIKSWKPTSEDLLEISSLTLSGLLAIFIVQTTKSNKELRKNKEKLERQYLAMEEQYNTLIRIKKDVLAGKKFEMAVESASDQVVITDPNGIILYANPAVEEISGYSPTKVLGKKAGAKELWGGQMDPSFYEKFWNTIKNQKNSFKGTFENKKKDGTKYYAQATVSPVLNREGEVQFFVGIERDITKEKEVEKMKNEFISLASHQLRTPLSAIRWYLEMLVEGDAGKLNNEQKEYAINVYESNQRMINLVNALLNVSRIESGRMIIEPKPTNIVNLVKEVIEEVKVKGKKKKQEIILSAHENLPLINLDPGLIRNVYQNLISNAIQYSPEGNAIEIFISKDGEELLSQVTDHGYGIPGSEHDKVFEKFFRASNAMKAEPGGTGLGLYLSKAIVESSGGRIWFESNENGTSFWFTIPLKGMEPKKGEVSIVS